MRFHLTDEQELIQDSIRRTLQDACPSEARRALVEAGQDFHPETWRALMALGAGGLALPESHGGSGLGLLDLALAAEVIGAQAAPGPYLGHALAGLAVASSEDETLKTQWLPTLASGETIGAVALGGDWTPETWSVQVADGRASGTVDLVPGGESAQLFVVGTVGGGLVLVEAAAGVTVEARPSSDLTRRVARVTLDGAPAIPLAAPGSAAGGKLLDAGLVLVAADALGGASTCLELSVDYAKTREQFGVPIGQFQAIKHQLANMALEVEPARALVWYAGYAADAGLPDASRAAAHAKAHLADRFTSVTRMAVQVHGGIGYTWDYDLQLWFRRALFDRAWLGAPSLHRERAAVMAGW